MGPYPVQEDQSKIPYICLGDSSEDETENRKHHPKKWMGKELKNDKVDGARTLVSLLNFLGPSFQLGNMKGDEKLFDEDGIYLMPKEEVLSEPETKEPSGKSDSSDESDEAEAETEIAGPDTPEPERTMETGPGVTEVHTENQTEKEAVEPEGDTEERNGEAETETPDSDSDIEIIGEVKKGLANPPTIIDIDDTATEQKSDKIKVEP